jgi:hypothetical protein
LAKYGKAAVTSRRFIPNSNEPGTEEWGRIEGFFKPSKEELKSSMSATHTNEGFVNNGFRITQSGPPPQSPGSGVDTPRHLNYRGFNEIKEKALLAQRLIGTLEMFKPFKKGCLNCV